MQRFASLCLALAFSALIVGCGGSSGNSADTDTAPSAGFIVQGAGVKGPLVGANVSAYLLDTLQSDLKGALVAVGSTNSMAQLDLEIPARFSGRGPFIIEYSNGSELNGGVPVIDRLTTILTNEQLTNSVPVYATPLSTLAIEYAAAIADSVDNTGISDPLTDDLAGNNDGLVSASEFIAALEVSTRTIADTLGLGLLTNRDTEGLGLVNDELDLFTTSPVIKAGTDPEETLAIRAANEVFAAIVENLATESATNGLGISGFDVLDSLAQDLSDGSFDGTTEGQPIAALSYINNIESSLTIDPSTVVIPGTDTTVQDIDLLLAAETQTLSPEMEPVELSTPVLEPPELTVYEESQTAEGTGTDTGEPANNVAPVLTLAFPAGNTSIEEGQDFGVLVQASDADGAIANCRLALNGQLVSQLSSPPYAWGTQSNTNDSMLNNMLAGSYEVVATCTDNEAFGSSINFMLTVTEVTEIPTPPPAPVAPEVSFANSGNPAAIVEGQDFPVTVIASDSDGTIDHCELRLDGAFLRNELNAPYEWGNSKDPALHNMAAGTYLLEATCVDSSGLATSASLQLLVEPESAPEPPQLVAPVTGFASPANNSTLNAGDTLSVSLNANDADGTIAWCDLYFDGQLVRRSLAAPHNFGTGSGFNDTALANLAVGSHTLEATCADNDQLTSSAQISVNVEAVPEPPLEIIYSDILFGWNIPTTRQNGEALAVAEIQGYEIYYYSDSSSGNEGTVISVPAQDNHGALVNQYIINNMASGSYWVTITTIDTQGVSSDIAQPLFITLP